MLKSKTLRSGVAAALLLAASAAPAADMLTDVPSAEAMTFDLLFIRPMGLVATVIGTGLFIVSLPFDLIAMNFSDPANRLVVEPFQFTFTRELGALD